MANPLRNEVAITLGGKQRTMRATFEAIVAIERDTRRSILQHQLRGDISVTDMATIVHQGLMAGSDPLITYGEVGAGIMEAGMTSESIYRPVLEFISKATAGLSVGKPDETPASS